MQTRRRRRDVAAAGTYHVEDRRNSCADTDRDTSAVLGGESPASGER
ncbi:MAG: hypothetical protein JW751_21420 [Polyangiaceae bacterium]|nr:hypothetical protein [Polyangiaceae bacterium]